MAFWGAQVLELSFAAFPWPLAEVELEVVQAGHDLMPVCDVDNSVGSFTHCTTV